MAKSIQELLAESVKAEVLTPELKTEIATIFEAQVTAKVNEKIETEKKVLEEKNKKELGEFKNTMIEKVDSYLAYTVENFFKTEKKNLTRSIKIEQAETLFAKLKTLFIEQKIETPKAKEVAKLETVKTINEELKTKLNKSLNEGQELKKQTFEYQKAIAFTKATANKTDKQKTEIFELMEGMTFNNLKDFKTKLDIVMTKVVAEVKATPKPKARVEDPNKSLVTEKTEVQGVDKYLSRLGVK